MGMISGIAALGLGLALGVQTVPSGERIYGIVLTAGGERLEGYLRWDRNETHWADILDGWKEIPREHTLEAERLDDELRRIRERERSVTFGGVRITWDEDDTGGLERTASAIRFGHIRSLEIAGERSALIELESGEHLDLSSSSTDIGRSFRGLVVDDSARGEVEVEWEDLVRVDFMSAPSSMRDPGARRLHGTVATRGGLRLTGLVAWDLDEALTTDVLDGEEDGEDVRLAFGDIAAIARETGSSARVTLLSGEEMILDDSNDVDSDNRGIEVTDPTFGRALVDWEEFESLTLHPRAGPPADRATFGAGSRLRGTVVARGVSPVSGFIRWDNDEEFTWETLDGESEGVAVAIEFGRVGTVERLGDESRVTLADGRTFMLDDSGDVGEDHRGVFIDTGAGETVLVRWRDFVSATFEHATFEP